MSVCDPQPPQVDKSVLVLVPEIVKKANGKTLGSPGPLWVGLQTLNKCLWAGANAPDLVHPAGAAPCLSPLAPRGKVGFARIDGKRGPRDLFPGPVNAEPIDALVKGGPQVVDNLSEDDCPVNGDRLIDLESVEVL